MDINCGILSGGKSSRMGEDKAFLKWKDSFFLGEIAKELSSFYQVTISVDNKEKYSFIPYKLIEDENKDIGPIEGIRRILLSSNTEYNFICATDMPFIKKEIVQYISEFISSDYDVYVILNGEKVHPLCGIYSRKILSTIEKMIEDKDFKLMNLISKVRTKYIDINKSCYSNKIIKNINTKKEYEKVKAPIIFSVSGIKNSGKTTVILGLIEEFKNLHKKVGVIKHDGHDFNIDHPGRDTKKFSDKGVEKVAIFSKSKYAFIHHKENTRIEEITEKMRDMDVIIIEGMKNSDYQKIEVVRAGISNKIICDKKTLFGVATNTEIVNLSKEINIFPIDDYKNMVKYIIENE